MCEGLELPWDYILLMILIYTAYDIFCINEFPPPPPRPSLPPHAYFFNPKTRPQSRLVLKCEGSCFLPSMVQPSCCQDLLELPGPDKEDNQNSGLVL